jgi:tetratricopeptide (TPR) repeat protein
MLHSPDNMMIVKQNPLTLDSVSNSVVNTTIPPIPDLNNPIEFEAWRWNCLEEQKIPRDVLANNLLTLNTTIARVRAAMLLATISPQRSRELAESVIRESQNFEYYMARVQLAHLDCIEACYDSSPKTKIQPCLLILRQLLIDLDKPLQNVAIKRELQVRTHHILVEACILNEEFEQAKYHAAEVTSIAPAIGLYYLFSSARYQLANVSFKEGNFQEALEYYSSIIDNPNTTNVIHQRAIVAKAMTLCGLGDEDAGDALFETLEAPSDPNLPIIGQIERLISYRYPGSAFPVDPKTKTVTPTVQTVSYIKHILLAQETDLHKVEERRNHLIAGQELMAGLHETALGWRKVYQRAWSAEIALQLDDLSLAKLRIPTVKELLCVPEGFRVLALANRVAIFERSLPNELELFKESLDALVNCLTNFQSHICRQVAEKLQLVNPIPLVLASRMVGCPDIVISAASHMMLNLKTRPISAFKKKGIRPLQAAKLILDSFDYESDYLLADGGGQQRSLKQVLVNQYHQRNCWFQPVPATRVGFVMLCLRSACSEKGEQQRLLQTYRDLKRIYGFQPTLHRSEKIAELEYICRHLDLAAQTEPSVSAVGLLFGRME